MQRLTQIQRLELTAGLEGEPTREQWAAFWAMGDVNLDGYIDDKDMELMQRAFGSTAPAIIGACDLNNDGKGDMVDVGTAAGNYGKNIWDEFGLPKPFVLPNWVAPLAIGIIIGRIVGL